MSNPFWIALGLGALYRGVSSPSPRSAPLGHLGTPTPQPALTRSTGVESIRFHPAGDIDNRVRFIREQILKDSLDKKTVTEARAVVSGRLKGLDGKHHWAVKPYDWPGEMQALYRAVTDPNSPMGMRYTRDHAEVDMFGSSDLMRRLPAGDCDDMAIRLGALLRSIGYAVRPRIVAPRDQPEGWAHIYLAVGYPPGEPPRKWVTIDPAESPRNGNKWDWEVPAGLISSKQDYDLDTGKVFKIR